MIKDVIEDTAVDLLRLTVTELPSDTKQAKILLQKT
jgi:hypothetical protein